MPRLDTVLHALRRAVDQSGDEVFLDFSGDTYTFNDIDRMSTRAAHALKALGVSAGDTAATVFENDVDVIVSWLAINKLGAIWVPVNTAYRGEFLRHQLDDSLACIVLCGAEFLASILEVTPQLPRVRHVLYQGPQQDVTSMHQVVEPLDRHRGSSEEPFELVAKPSDLAFLMYTSGTTGPSKGCMISHNYICNQGFQSNLAVPPRPGDIGWTCLPFYHMAAVDTLVGALLAVHRIAIAPRFSVSNFWPDIHRSGATVARLMASIFPLIAHMPETPEMKKCHGQLRAVSGVPVSAREREIWKTRFGVKFINSFAYGQTEGCRLSMSTEADQNPPETSAGKVASDFYDLQIVDENDVIQAPGVVGEIVYRPLAPHIMFSGFWRRPQDTVAVWQNLWMHTGDIGRIEDGYLYFMDRKKDYLRSRGENVSSFEVERVFLSHSDVREVALHAVTTGAGEDVIKATMVLHESASVTAEQLCRWAMDKLPYFAVPRFIEFREQLPRTHTGKIMKYQLREEGVSASTWDREAAGIEVRRT